jgi:dihydroorotase
MMTRFLGLGFTLDQVVTMCTANPARAIGVDGRLGSLAVGRQADVSILRIREGEWTVHDTVGGSMRVSQAVMPVMAVKRGEVFSAHWGPRPWGWEPDPGPAGAVSCC